MKINTSKYDISEETPLNTITQLPQNNYEDLGFYSMLRKGALSVHANLISSVFISPNGNKCKIGDSETFSISDILLEKIIQQVNSVAANPEFIWFGSKPLQAGIGFYRKVVKLQKKHGLLDNAARNSIQINDNILDEDWAQFLRENNFNIGIDIENSLNKEDKSNYIYLENESQNKVMQMVNCLKKHDKIFGILTIYNKKGSSPEKLMNYFMKNKVFKFDISLNYNNLDISATDYADYICELFDLWLSWGESSLRIKFFDDLIQTFWGLSSNICWLNGNCPNNIRVDLEGNVWPCCDHVLPYDQYRLGNINQESMIDILQGEKFLRFRKVYSELPTRCLGCEWSHICKGGCAYHRLINGGGEDGGDHLCAAYKKIFQHIFDRYKTLFN
ncbi:MAG: SPASM domain-containing protein [Candidatus Schekmanbacteria bacterium]|nr:SPASM domain-containing protein [Candidatus Schekmanbacteria bacterium]